LAIPTNWVGATYAIGSTNTVRGTTFVYPNGRALTFDYGTAGSASDRLSRIAALVDDDDTHLAEYQYLGLGAVVQIDSPQPDLRMTLVDLSGSNDPDTGDLYAGVDRFGRVKDLRWRNVTGNTDLSRVRYGYDRASNRTWRANPTDASSHHDWLYAYDGLQRLEDAERGTLAGGQTAIDDPQFRQCWTLDAVGNWSGFREADSGGAWSLIQSRTTNPVNEITAITNTVGPAWAQPAYDAAGNMTTVPWRGSLPSGLGWAELTVNEWAALTPDQWSNLLVSSSPTPPAGSLAATYDAWNRLVRAAGEDLDEAYAYDATNYRITTSRGASVRHCYYTNAWQVVEERTGSSSTANRQFVWGLRYLDDLVLRDRGSERLYALQDGNWNVTAVVDHAGAVVERYEYDPYGVPKFFDADFDPRAASAHDWETLYAGYRWNARTGLYCARNRAYLPELGTWLTRDPIGYVGGSANLLEYVKSHPLVANDPSGLQDPSPSLSQSLSDYFPGVFPAPTYTEAPFDPVASVGYLLPNMTQDERRLLEQATDLGMANNVAWLILEVRKQMAATYPYFEGYGGEGPCFSFNRKLHERIAGLDASLEGVGVRLNDPQWNIDFPSMALATNHIALSLQFPNGQTVFIDAGWKAYVQGNLGGIDNIFFAEDIPFGLKGPFERSLPPPRIPEPQCPPHPLAPGPCQPYVPFDRYRDSTGQVYYR
jgi:RHS repeat-associated protein